jgi:hypothetical protein
VAILFIGFYNDVPFVDAEMEQGFSYMVNDIPIVAIWDYGHAIIYFTNKSVLYRASPKQESMDIISKAYLAKDLSILDQLDISGSYYIYIGKYDLLKSITYSDRQGLNYSLVPGDYYNAELVYKGLNSYVYLR